MHTACLFVAFVSCLFHRHTVAAVLLHLYRTHSVVGEEDPPHPPGYYRTTDMYWRHRIRIQAEDKANCRLCFYFRHCTVYKIVQQRSWYRRAGSLNTQYMYIYRYIPQQLVQLCFVHYPFTFHTKIPILSPNQQRRSFALVSVFILILWWKALQVI